MEKLSKIKYSIYRILVWCAGADPDVLENRARFSDKFQCGRSEQIKHAWTGALVLIPSTLAFCGMMYAAATLDISQAGVTGIAFIWAIVVFILERYIVATFRKSDSVLRDLVSVTFLVRLIFSIGVGMTIADPLVHGVFKESIEEQLGEMNLAEIDSIRSQSRIMIAREDSTISNLYKRKKQISSVLRAKEDSIARFDQVLTDEIDGRVGSGKIGDGPSAKEKRAIRDRMLVERNRLSAQDSFAQMGVDSTIAQTESLKKKILSDTEERIHNKQFSTDYLARRHALAALSSKPENADIWWVRLFLTIFLIFIDVCCVLYKAASVKGAYDDHINYEDFLSDTERRKLLAEKNAEVRIVEERYKT